MSDSADTIGIAHIEVTSLNQVTVTRRVKSAAGIVVWSVHNNTASPLTVCVTHFRSVAVKKDDFQSTFLLATNCTQQLRPDGIGVIAGAFHGNPGSILTYDVELDG